MGVAGFAADAWAAREERLKRDPPPRIDRGRPRLAHFVRLARPRDRSVWRYFGLRELQVLIAQREHGRDPAPRAVHDREESPIEPHVRWTAPTSEGPHAQAASGPITRTGRHRRRLVFEVLAATELLAP